MAVCSSKTQPTNRQPVEKMSQATNLIAAVVRIKHFVSQFVPQVGY
jgi:hypothetical protein